MQGDEGQQQPPAAASCASSSTTASLAHRSAAHGGGPQALQSSIAFAASLIFTQPGPSFTASSPAIS